MSGICGLLNSIAKNSQSISKVSIIIGLDMKKPLMVQIDRCCKHFDNSVRVVDLSTDFAHVDDLNLIDWIRYGQQESVHLSAVVLPYLDLIFPSAQTVLFLNGADCILQHEFKKAATRGSDVLASGRQRPELVTTLVTDLFLDKYYERHGQNFDRASYSIDSSAIFIFIPTLVKMAAELKSEIVFWVTVTDPSRKDHFKYWRTSKASIPWFDVLLHLSLDVTLGDDFMISQLGKSVVIRGDVSGAALLVWSGPDKPWLADEHKPQHLEKWKAFIEPCT